MIDETNAYGVKINGVTFISLPSASEAVKEARKDARDLAFEEAAKIFDMYAHDPFTASAVAEHLRKMKEKT